MVELEMEGISLFESAKKESKGASYIFFPNLRKYGNKTASMNSFFSGVVFTRL